MVGCSAPMEHAPMEHVSMNVEHVPMGGGHMGERFPGRRQPAIQRLWAATVS